MPWRWRRRKLPCTVQQNGERAPDYKCHHHHRGDLHDTQSRRARFLDAPNVAPPKIERDEYAEYGGESVWVYAQTTMTERKQLIRQKCQVLSGADAADGAGQNVIEDQRRDRNLGH